jgi:hypothetical protein
MSDFARQFSQAFAQANPHIGGNRSASVRVGQPAPIPESVRGRGCSDAARTVVAGGAMSQLLLHPTFVPFELTFRKLPDDGVYTANRINQYAFELGSFTVPTSMSLAVAEYSFRPYRISGAAPGEAVPLETGRLSLELAYDLNIDQYRKGNIKTQVVPKLPSPAQNAFAGNPTGGSVFQQAVGGLAGSASLASFNSDVTSGLTNYGDALIIQGTKTQQGPEKFPFTYYVKSNQAVQMRVIVFGQITIPLAFFEGVLSGYLMPQNTLESMLDGVSPCQ